jgi:hypothetical protein
MTKLLAGTTRVDRTGRSVARGGIRQCQRGRRRTLDVRGGAALGPRTSLSSCPNSSSASPVGF